MKTWKPGEKAMESGIYELVDSNGSRTGFTVKVSADDHFPPADKQGQMYVKTGK